MNKQALGWLYKEMPELVAKGILPEETAEKIHEYYGPLPSVTGHWTLITMFSLIGSVLFGLGIILIIGHNWDRLNHMTRLFISLGWLWAAQAAAAYSLWRKVSSKAWLEGTAIFLLLSLGGAIGLVGQTYHLVDDFANFMLIWLLLSLPLVYLMDARGVAGLYLAGILVWLDFSQQSGLAKFSAWGLLALIIPYYFSIYKRDHYANSTVVLFWLLAFCIISCFGMSGEKQLWKFLYASLFSGLYFAGMLWFKEEAKILQKPFQAIGLFGCIILTYLLSFKNFWEVFPWTEPLTTINQWEGLLAVCLAVTVGILAFLLRQKALVRPGLVGWLIGALPVTVAAAYLLQISDNSGIGAAILINLYLLTVSVLFIRKGTKQAGVWLLNVGMLMLSALILLRFFDFSYSFVVRGIAFILTGLAFLTVNLVISRRKDEVSK